MPPYTIQRLKITHTNPYEWRVTGPDGYTKDFYFKANAIANAARHNKTWSLLNAKN